MLVEKVYFCDLSFADSVSKTALFVGGLEILHKHWLKSQHSPPPTVFSKHFRFAFFVVYKWTTSNAFTDNTTQQHT